MDDAHDSRGEQRALLDVFAMRAASGYLPRVSRAQRAVCKGRVAGLLVS